MLFHWSDFLALAEDLSKRDDEAALRTAASRLYYYVYHLGRQRIVDNGFQFGRGGSHKQVWEQFAADMDSRCHKLKDVGKILQEKRNRADYETSYPLIKREFPVLLEMARKFAVDLNALDKHLPAIRP